MCYNTQQIAIMYCEPFLLFQFYFPTSSIDVVVRWIESIWMIVVVLKSTGTLELGLSCSVPSCVPV